MELSTSTNIYFNRPDGSHAPIEKSIRLCGDAGYRRMDMNFVDCVNFNQPFVTDNWESWVDRLLAVANEKGINFSQAHAPFYNFCDASYPNKEFMDKMIYRSVDCAAKMGVPWLVIHAGTDYNSAWMISSSKQKNREYFLPLIEYAAKRGVGIAVENLWEYNIAPRRRYTTCIEELVELVDVLDSKFAGICYDTDHVALSGMNQKTSLLAIGSRLKATHISDCVNIECDHNVPFSGKTNWKDVLEGLRDIQYQGDFTYEMHRFTAFLPDALVPSALKYSVEVGHYMMSFLKDERSIEL